MRSLDQGPSKIQCNTWAKPMEAGQCPLMNKIIYPLCTWEIFAFKAKFLLWFSFLKNCFKMSHTKEQMLQLSLVGLQLQLSSRKCLFMTSKLRDPLWKCRQFEGRKQSNVNQRSDQTKQCQSTGWRRDESLWSKNTPFLPHGLFLSWGTSGYNPGVIFFRVRSVCTEIKAMIL